MIIDRSIPYKHIIMRLDPSRHICAEPRLPVGYSFHAYETGDDLNWARIQHSVNEFPTLEKAQEWFNKNYLATYGNELLGRGQFFVMAPDGTLVADCTIRRRSEFDCAAYRMPVTQMDWVACMPDHQRKGLASALMRWLLNEHFAKEPNESVFLNTQPASYTAVRMYWNLGFRVSRSCEIAGGEKTEPEALEIIEQFYPDGFAQVLCDTSVE